MAEVIGTVASIITLAQVVIELIKHAKTFYRAQAEFDVLHEQLAHFTALLHEIESLHETFNSSVITTSLSQAKITIEQLHQLIQVKILQHANGTSRARRRAWMRNKSKICDIRDALKEYRENLLTAISANSLLSARRSEAILTMINRDVGHKKELTLSIDRSLSEMHQSILETKQAVLSQPEIFHHILQSTSPYDYRLRTITARPLLPWHPGRDFSESLVCSFSSQSHDVASPVQMQAVSTTENHQQKESEGNDRSHVVLRSQRSFVACEPKGPFEVSSNFFPETYTTDQRLYTSSLIITSAKELHSSTRSKTNWYRFLYLKSPRQWSRLDISIEIFSSSSYWTATKLSRHENLFPPTFVNINFECSLPKSLLEKIKHYLSRADDQNENTNIRLCLSTEDVIKKHQSQILEMPSQSLITATKLSNMAQNILKFLDDLGCQQFVESQVIQVEVIVLPICFASLVDGMLVCEIKFYGDFPGHKDLYDIQVLRGMDAVPGFSKLVGIVVDNSKKHLKSYSVEIPQTKWDLVCDLVTDASTITWERRENWARQVVEGVRQLHSKSFVVGNLWRFRQPIIVDVFDRVQFWTFDKQFVPYTSRSCFYPPEYTYFEHTPSATNEVEFPHITPKGDIFLLGTMLWYLAMGFPTPRFCQEPLKETQRLAIPFEFQDVDGSTFLPPLPESIPKYYRDMVDECRSVDPSDRPSAWRLLERFPPRSNHEQPRNDFSGLRSVDLSLRSIKKAFKRGIWCSHCWNGVKESFFHCYICNEGDFDLCLRCYNQGRHCHNRDHLLVELVEVESVWTVSNRYHPMARNSVGREVIEL